MSLPGQILKEIHRLRKHAADLTTKIEQAPRQLKIQETKLAKQEDVLRQAQEEIKHLKVQIHEKEVSIKGVLGIVKKHEKQLDEAASKKEYDALKAEIDHEKKGITKLEDEILDAMAKVEDESAKLPEMEKTLTKARTDFAQFQKDQEERLVRWAAEKERAMQELALEEAKLPEEVMVVYNRQVNSRGEDALAAVENRTCAACYTEITFQMFNDLARNTFVFCKSCGRILYLPE